MFKFESLLPDIFNHAEREYPRECCGLVVVVKGKRRYIACYNSAKSDDQFLIDYDDYARAEELGEVVAIVHSHCNISAKASQADMVGCEESGLPWIIVSLPLRDVNVIKPSGYQAPLIGREYLHGVLDCFSLVRDYYKQTLGIELNNYERADNWWRNGKNLYLDNFEREGFVRVFDKPQKHDAFLMQLNGSPVPQHAAVYIGDNLIMHHATNRLSSRDVYGGYWQKVTTHILRHKDLL